MGRESLRDLLIVKQQKKNVCRAGGTKARLFTGRDPSRMLELSKGDGARGNESFGKEGVSVQWVTSAWLAHRLPGTHWEPLLWSKLKSKCTQP